MSVIATGTIPNTSFSIKIKKSKILFNSSNSNCISSVYDPVFNKLILAYRDSFNEGKGVAVIGSVNGDNIFFNEPVVFNAGDTSNIACTYDPFSNKLIIAYTDCDNNKRGVCVVGTVDSINNTISFGNPVVFNNKQTDFISVVYDSNAGKVVIAYRDTNTYGTAIVGNIRLNSIKFGEPIVFNDNDTWGLSATYVLSESKIVIVYQNCIEESYSTSIVGEVDISSNTIKFGDPIVFNKGTRWDVLSVYNIYSNKIAIVQNNPKGTIVIGSVTEHRINFGDSLVFDNNKVDYASVIYNPFSSKIYITYEGHGGNGYGAIIAGMLNGKNISFEKPYVKFNDCGVRSITTTYDAIYNKIFIVYQDSCKEVVKLTVASVN